MGYTDQDIPDTTWKRMTAEEKRRWHNHLCMKCGKPITKQNFYGSLCEQCNVLYFLFDAKDADNSDSESTFLAFIRDNKERVQFT
jgi:hypothetical protein